jgi:hypothetical protein
MFIYLVSFLFFVLIMREKKPVAWLANKLIISFSHYINRML